MSAENDESAKLNEASLRLYSIRVRLLVVTSSVILVFVAVLITLDYQREIRHHFDEKHSDLLDEARTVLPAVLHLQNHGSDAVQRYIDSICERMDDANSPDHHIVVTFGTDHICQSNGMPPLSRDRIASIIAASENSDTWNPLQDHDLLTAAYADGNSQVIVSENVSHLRSAVFGDFASLILIEANLTDRLLRYANAGHDPAWLIDPSGDATELVATGTVLGIDEDATWNEKTIELSGTSRLAVSTDGMTETFGADEEMYGKKRLLQTLLSCKNQSLEETKEHTNQTVASHRGSGEQTDDVTLLLMEFTFNEASTNNQSNRRRRRVDTTINAAD
ncbi:MAG: serine/threonine-protein phosphatase [Planctomycetales bacterium]|nr:serine/threonine-protein phosphatase [Planctomycetales bacterium]